MECVIVGPVEGCSFLGRCDLLRSQPKPAWGGRTETGSDVMEVTIAVILTYVSVWPKRKTKGASIACDATAVVIGSCPLGGGLGRRALGAVWIARDPTCGFSRKALGRRGLREYERSRTTTGMNGRHEPSRC